VEGVNHLPISEKEDKKILVITEGTPLMLTTYKIVSIILLSKLAPHEGEIIGVHQCGFRRNRSTTDQIFCIRQIFENKWQ